MKRPARYRSAITAFNQSLPGCALIRALTITAMALALSKAATLVWDASVKIPTAPLDGSGLWTSGAPSFLIGSADESTGFEPGAFFGNGAAVARGYSLAGSAASQVTPIGSKGIAMNLGVSRSSFDPAHGQSVPAIYHSPHLLTPGAPAGNSIARIIGICADGVALKCSGSSFETLPGASTYTGATTVSAGGLAVTGSRGGASGVQANRSRADLLPSSVPVPGGGAVLLSSDGAASEFFGISVNLSGAIGLVGATAFNQNQGAAYVFRNLDTATGTVTQNVKLIASDGAAYDFFGSVSVSGAIGLVGAPSATYNSTTGGGPGAAYVFRNLDTATGTVTQNVKLTASDFEVGFFGDSVSLSGTIGLVGAYLTGENVGAAYVFRNLDMATGTVTQNVKLAASDGAAHDDFGDSVSLSGTIGLVGAVTYNNATNSSGPGAAYVFRNLDTATGAVTQNAKLIASDGAAGDSFGYSVSLSGVIGLVGATAFNQNQGAAYVFRNLDTATGTVTQNVKLIASDGAEGDQFGNSVSLSGAICLVGAPQYVSSGTGVAYVFRNLDTSTGTVTQDVKLTASDGALGDNFGYSVSLNGDLFIIGALHHNSSTGKAYTGSVSSLTTLDAGNTAITIGEISFVSQDNWIIGQTTSGNQVTLSAGNSANVTASGMGVYIGQNAGSNNNTLIIAGSLTANQITVGAVGNTGNTLQLGAGGTTGTLSTSSVITDNGTVIFDRSNTITQGTDFGSAAITGTGGVTQAGTGTTILNAANTYSGGTTVNAGTLQISGSGSLGNGAYSGAISNSSVLECSSNAAQTFSGDINGTGALMKDISSTSTLTLSGANTYTGATTVSAGTLQFAREVSLYNNTPASAENVTVAIGAMLAFNVGGPGEFTSSDLDAIQAHSTGFAGGALLGLDTTNAASGNFAYASAIVDTNGGANSMGLVKLGTGALTLSAANTYTGGTTVQAGALIVSGSINGSATVQNGGTLGGTGSVGSVEVQSGGKLEPGLTPSGPSQGVFTASSLTWDGGGTLFFALSTTSSASSDLSLGTGVLTQGLAGVFAFDFLGGGEEGQTYDLINFASTTFTSASQFTATDLAPGLGGNFILTSSELLFFVPEPSPWAALASGAGLLIGLRRFRRGVRA